MPLADAGELRAASRSSSASRATRSSRSGPLAQVASGGELSRIALAIQVVTSEVGEVPTLIFDEVDVGIGGAVAATVGRLLQSLGARRQVLCVTHLPQVAAFADAHFRVTKRGDADAMHAGVDALAANARVEELARMLAGRRSPRRRARTPRNCWSSTAARRDRIRPGNAAIGASGSSRRGFYGEALCWSVTGSVIRFMYRGTVPRAPLTRERTSARRRCSQ